MKQFETGKTYTMRSACDHNCVWSYTVIARTAATVKLQDDMGKVTTHRICKKLSEYCGIESVKPLGDYSMAPILRA